MESFSGGMNPNIGKKFITLEDGTSVEAPEGVSDAQDYKEFMAEQEARVAEADRRKEAVSLASKIENSVDEKLVKSCLVSGDFSPIFAALGGVDSMLTKGDQIRIDQDGRKMAEIHDRYDAMMAEAMEILRNEYFGEKVIEASEAAAESADEVIDGGGTVEEGKEAEEGQEAEKTRDEMLEELMEEEGGPLDDKNAAEIESLSDEEVKDLYRQWFEKKGESKDGDPAEADDTEEAAKKPLVAVNLDRTRDAEAAARDIAERMLKEDLESGKGAGKFIKNIWKGNMFRGYYVEKNKRLAYERILAKQQGKESNLGDDAWQNRSDKTVDRFISEYDEMIHKDAGEWRDALPENHPASVAAKEAISKFARGELDEKNFSEEMKRVTAQLKDGKGNPKGEVVLDNYLEIARAAKGRFDHEEGIESIMEGFRLINGEARTGVRTEAHLKGLDKLMNRYEHSRVGRFLPPELVAGAASIANWLALAGSKNVVKAATFGFGGAAITGLAAGLKEGSRVATDRAQMAREAASGLAIDASEKYDKQVSETLYDMTSASAMSKALRSAMESGDKKAILQRLAFVDTRIKLSDTRNIDLICYSDPAKIEDERFALDLARAEALAKLRNWPAEAEADDAKTIGVDEALNRLISGYEKVLDEGTEGNRKNSIKARDKAFRSLRRKQMIKQGVKTGLVAAGTMVAAQELWAAFSPDSYGLADAAFGLENNAGAHNTLLAGLVGIEAPVPTILGGGGAVAEQAGAVEQSTGAEQAGAREASGVKLTDEQVAQLKQENYAVIKVESVTMQDQEVNMDVREYANKYGVRVERTDWGANGTTFSDGNELSAHYTANGDGIVTSMSGNSTTWGGESISFQDAVEDGRIKAFVSLTGDSQATPIEVTGRLINGGTQVEFIPEAGSAAAECFEDGKFIGKYFEVAFDSGVEGDVQQIVPLSTVVGEGIDGATFADTVQVPVADTSYNVIWVGGETEGVAEGAFVGPMPEGQAQTGVSNLVAMLPFVRRQNLRAPRRRVETPEGGTPAAVPTTPIGSPEGTSAGNAPEEPEAIGGVATPEIEEYDAEGEPIWENLADRIGGSEGIRIVNGELDTMPEVWRNMVYQNWWDNLSKEMQDRFAGRDGRRLSPESDTLFDWLFATGKAIDATPAGESTEPVAAAA